MKHIFTAILLFSAVAHAAAQTDVPVDDDFRRRGFIGISVGSGIPVGTFAKPDKSESEFGAGMGAQFNVVNLGLRLSEHVGFTYRWFGLSFPVNFEGHFDGAEDEFEPWIMGGMLIGPMVSFPIERNLELDFRPMFGYNITTFPIHKDEGKSITGKGALALSMSVNLQLKLSNRFALHTGLEYFTSKATLETVNFTQKIKTITPSVGIFYRFGRP